MGTEAKLRVVEAIQDDVNKGIVRIDSAFMREIDVRPGDIVEIEGQRKTVAIADRALPGDIGLSHIRMDGLSRKNAQTGIGETVKIRKVEVKEAKKITIAPAREGIIVKTSSPYVFKQGLLGRAAVKGDIISLGGARRRRTTMSGSPFFDEVFSMMEENMGFGGVGFGFGDLKFVVAETNPKQPVIITDATEIVLNPEAMPVEEDAIPGVTYEDIGGLEDEVKKIREMVELPLKHPEIFQRLGVDAPKGVLLHGPPGTGKTLLARAVASETNSHFLVINGPEIMSKYYGQSEENLRKKFEEAEKNAPSIIFIDEIDAIASKREETRGEVERRVVAQLLALMDGLKSRGRVVVIAATNVPNILDPALRRPGRFDRELEIGVPNKEGRLNILKIHTRNTPIEHWDTINAASVLSKKIFSYESETTDIIREKHKKLQNLRSELKDANIEYESSIAELKELERQKRNAPSNLINRIIDKMSLKQDDIAKVEKAIKNGEDKIKKFSDEIKLHEKSVTTINRRKDEISTHQDLLERIVKQIELLRQSKEIKEEKDPRVKLIDEQLREKDAKVTEIIDDLSIAGVVSNDFFEEVKKESVQTLLKEIATTTHGFVGADLASLTKESAMIVLRNNQSKLKYEKDEVIPEEILQTLQIKKDDFKEALKVVRPSALREVLVEVPNINWTDIGGLQTVKQELMEAVEWPLKHPDAFKRLGVKPPKGILLYGAPGTGKTLMAKAVAHESEANFISIKGPELLSKWVGESEKAVREIFKKARQTAPTIIFFDEIDSLVPRRGSSSDSNVTERVVNQLLTEIDGLEDLHDIVIIGATNRPDMVDTALLRPGRFDRIILTPVPDKPARLEVLKVHTKGMPLKDVDIDYLAEQTEGFVGADIEALCREAAMLALREDIKGKVITADHFEQALMKVAPSVTKDIEQSYIVIQDKFKSARAKEMKAEARPLYFG